MKIFAIRKPENLKGVFTTKQDIKKAKESIRYIEGCSYKTFEDNQIKEAYKWAGIEFNPNDEKLKDTTKMNSIEKIISICDEFRESGYSFIQLYLSDGKTLGIFLEGAATGEIRRKSEDGTEEENIKYSIKNKFVKIFASKTEIKYVEPFLVLKNTWLASNVENRGTKNTALDHEISTILNMELIDIVEARAFDKYQYLNNCSVYTIDKATIDLYKRIKPYL